jgi:hypothetical protein
VTNATPQAKLAIAPALAKDRLATDLAVIGHDDIVAASVPSRCWISNWGNDLPSAPARLDRLAQCPHHIAPAVARTRAVSTASTVLRLRRGKKSLAVLQ